MYPPDGQTDGQTDRQTDGREALQYLPSQAFGAVGDKKQGTNVSHNARGGLLIDLTIIDITQWNVGAVVLEQFKQADQ